MNEVIYWYEGRPTEEDRYLIQDNDGVVDISYYFINGNIFRHEMESDTEVVRYARVPVGK